jgi:hypothetical protein
LRLCAESVGFLLQSFIGGSAELFRISPLSDRVFLFLLSCKDVDFAVYRRHSFICSSFKVYLHLWNSGGPNWIKEWQLYSDEESSSWTLVSRRRNSQASFADVVRKPALSSANLVPLGGPVRAGLLSSGMHQRSSVFNRISYPVHHPVDQLASRSNSPVKFARRAQFQNYSKFSNGRLERLNFRSSLRGSCVWPWASRNLIWHPKKILKQHQEISGHKSVLSINGTPDHVSTDSRFARGNSISGNNCQLFGISGQNCKRDFLSFPSKFENVSWEYSPRRWFKATRLLSAGGPSPPPFLNNFGEFAQAVLPRSGSSPSTELALFTKPSSSSLPWAIPSLSSPHLRGVCSSRPPPPPFEVSEGMVFHIVDPAPFLPHGFVAQQVDH